MKRHTIAMRQPSAPAPRPARRPPAPVSRHTVARLRQGAHPPSAQRTPVAPDALGGLLARAVAERAVPAPGPGPVLARKHGGTDIGDLTAAAITRWERAVSATDRPEAVAAATALDALDREALIRLVIHKMAKHVEHTDKANMYIYSLPQEVLTTAMERAVVQRNVNASRLLITLLAVLLTTDRARAVALVRDHPEEFLDAGVTALRDPRNATRFYELLRDRGFMAALPDDTRDRLAEMIPLLRAVRGTTVALDEGATEIEIVDELFRALTRGDMNVGYVATALSLPSVALLGAPPARGRGRAAPSRVLLDCHRLTEVFNMMVKTHPGVRLEARGENISEALLTVPLTELPGGLIANTFGGNVFDDDGRPTRQIFFSGALAMDSHTYSVVGGRAYDSLFGTRGPQVAASVAATFQRMVDARGRPLDNVWRERNGGPRYMVKSRRHRPAANTHHFSSGYVLTTNPARHGVNPAGLRLNEDDVLVSESRQRIRDERAARELRAAQQAAAVALVEA